MALIPTELSTFWIINADGTGAMPLTNLTAAGADSFLRLTD